MNSIFLAYLFISTVCIEFCISWPTFYYYPSADAQPQVLNSSGLLQAPFSPTFQTIFLSHGYRGSYTSSFCIVGIKNALFQNTNSNNIILVDWSAGSGDIDKPIGTDYPQARLNSQVAGKAIGSFVTKNKIPLGKVYCIGFSMGSHVCGSAGKSLGGKIARITGLDPAGPLFTKKSPLTLSPTDAIFVDVIHTTKYVGTQLASGFVDFYANYDNNPTTPQPGCPLKSLSCGHYAVCNMFGNSTRTSCGFTANLCTKINRDVIGRNFDYCMKNSTTETARMGYFATKKGKSGESYVIKTDITNCQP